MRFTEFDSHLFGAMDEWARAWRSRRDWTATKVFRQYVLLAFLLGLALALGSSVIVYNAWRIYLNGDRYRPAVFVVDQVYYYRGAANNFHTWTATGWIDGAEEKLSLMDFAPEPESVSQLRAQFPAGTRIEVWYDPSAPPVRTQGTYLRVLPRDLNLDNALRRAILQTAMFDGLLLLAIFVAVVWIFVSGFKSILRRRQGDVRRRQGDGRLFSNTE
jgi:hypothetical protein